MDFCKLWLHVLYFTQTLMDHTLGRHSLIFSWWLIRTWSRRSHRSNTLQEFSASSFTSLHDRVVLLAEAPFHLGFRESTVAFKYCGLLMYEFASLGLAVNCCEICICFLISLLCNLGSLLLDQCMSTCMVSGHFTRNLCRPCVHVQYGYGFYAPGKAVTTLFIVAGGSSSDVFSACSLRLKFDLCWCLC